MIEPGQKALRRKSLRDDALNLPNLLTMGRVAAIPLVLWLMWIDTRETNFWAMMLYSAAAVTDFIDGYLARRMGLTSLLGKFLDPLADKLIVLATLVMMVAQGRNYLQTAWWLAFWPGVAIILTTMSLNLLSSWLRTATDPTQRWRLEIGEHDGHD